MKRAKAFKRSYRMKNNDALRRLRHRNRLADIFRGYWDTFLGDGMRDRMDMFWKLDKPGTPEDVCRQVATALVFGHFRESYTYHGVLTFWAWVKTKGVLDETIEEAI